MPICQISISTCRLHITFQPVIHVTWLMSFFNNHHSKGRNPDTCETWRWYQTAMVSSFLWLLTGHKPQHFQSLTDIWLPSKTSWYESNLKIYTEASLNHKAAGNTITGFEKQNKTKKACHLIELNSVFGLWLLHDVIKALCKHPHLCSLCPPATRQDEQLW